jgi:hypothetical protein
MLWRLFFRCPLLRCMLGICAPAHGTVQALLPHAVPQADAMIRGYQTAILLIDFYGFPAQTHVTMLRSAPLCCCAAG